MIRVFVFFAGILSLIFFPIASEAYEAIAVTNGGSVAGKVTFQGSPPPPVKLLVTKDHHVCGKGQIERREVDVKDGALQGTVVFLEKVDKGKPFPKEVSSATIDQRKCAFLPYFQVVKDRSKLTILNSDPVLHNIHAYELIGKARRSMFNIAQPKSKPKVTKRIRVRRGNVVRIECDAHNWMLGWLFVAKNPYYAVVGEDGSFRIDDVPPGTYTLKATHPALGTVKKKVTMKPKGTASVSFAFTTK